MTCYARKQFCLLSRVSGVRIPDGSPNRKIPESLERQGVQGFFLAILLIVLGDRKDINQHINAHYGVKKGVVRV